MKSNDFEVWENDILNSEAYGGLYNKNVPIVYDMLKHHRRNDIIDEFSHLFKSCPNLRRRAFGKKLYSTPDRYVLLFFDENEICIDQEKEIQFLKNAGVFVFGVLVLPDTIILPEHDVSGIPVIIKSNEACIDFPLAVTIRRKFNENMRKYMLIIQNYCSVHQFSKHMMSTINEVKSMYNVLDSIWESKNTSDWENISINWDVQCLYEILNEGERIIKQSEEKMHTFISQIKLLESNCESEIVEKRFNVKSAGKYATDLLYRYGAIKENINKQLLEMKKDQSLTSDNMFFNTLQCCMDELNEKNSVAFVGTFSSGKTSFINWLLDMTGDRQLRTSGGHNTAILTCIKSCSADNEKVCVKYKYGENFFEWDLFTIEEEGELADYYDGEANAIVSDIDEIGRRISFSTGRGKKTSIILKNKYDDIIVKPNQIMKKGDALTKGYRTVREIPIEASNYNIRPVEEYDTIIDAIQKNDIKNVCVYIYYFDANPVKVTDKRTILKLLARIKALQVRFSSKKGRLVDIPGKFWQINGLKGTSHFSKVKIKAECYLKDQEEILSDSVWKKYCGTGSNEDYVFTERPEGYMFTSNITYFLEKAFLEYSNIIDTPGLGSLSEEHDAITESYIRGCKDNLLVVIKINKNAESQRQKRFISEIANIYEKSCKNKDNVFFLCNIWSKQANSDIHIANTFKRYCDNAYEMIQQNGFNMNNFFVIDMHEMQKGTHVYEMYGFPSDKKFEEEFVRQIANAGIQTSLININKRICDNFNMLIKDYERTLQALDEEKLTKEQNIHRYQEEIKGKNKITMNSFEALYRDNSSLRLMEEFQGIVDTCVTFKSWKNIDSFLSDIDMIEKMVYETNEDGNAEDSIIDDYILKLNKLQAAEQVMRFEKKGITKFPFTTLKNRIQEIQNSFKSKIHFIKNRKISEEGSVQISEFIDNQLSLCWQDNIDNYNMLNEQIEKIKREQIAKVVEQIALLQNESYYEENKVLYYKRINSLKNLLDSWKNNVSTDMRKVGINNGY